MSADDDGTGDVTMADPRNPGGDAEFEEIREQVRTKIVSRVKKGQRKQRRFLDIRRLLLLMISISIFCNPQDRYLPIANIARIMKNTLPENAKVAKDSKEQVQFCVSEFISFITSEASDKCQQEKRKTINGDDLLWAMSTLGFDKYVEPLKEYLRKYLETVRSGKQGDGGT